VARAKRRAARKLSFGEAVAEVEAILERLEEDAVDIDDLAEEVRRAVELIKICREKLGSTDHEVRELVAELEGEETTTDGSAGAGGASDTDPTDLPF
jgi:exodeoxyribonuclease VII small subunit